MQSSSPTSRSLSAPRSHGSTPTTHLAALPIPGSPSIMIANGDDRDMLAFATGDHAMETPRVACPYEQIICVNTTSGDMNLVLRVLHSRSVGFNCVAKYASATLVFVDAGSQASIYRARDIIQQTQIPVILCASVNGTVVHPHPFVDSSVVRLRDIPMVHINQYGYNYDRVISLIVLALLRDPSTNVEKWSRWGADVQSSPLLTPAISATLQPSLPQPTSLVGYSIFLDGAEYTMSTRIKKFEIDHDKKTVFVNT